MAAKHAPTESAANSAKFGRDMHHSLAECLENERFFDTPTGGIKAGVPKTFAFWEPDVLSFRLTEVAFTNATLDELEEALEDEARGFT